MNVIIVPLQNQDSTFLEESNLAVFIKYKNESEMKIESNRLSCSSL